MCTQKVGMLPHMKHYTNPKSQSINALMEVLDDRESMLKSKNIQCHTPAIHPSNFLQIKKTLFSMKQHWKMCFSIRISFFHCHNTRFTRVISVRLQIWPYLTLTNILSTSYSHKLHSSEHIAPWCAYQGHWWTGIDWSDTVCCPISLSTSNQNNYSITITLQ